MPIDEAERAQQITSDFAREIGATKVVYDEGVVRLSVIGAAIVANSDIASKFFKALYDIGVNIQMISTSDVKIYCVIDKGTAKEEIKKICS